MKKAHNVAFLFLLALFAGCKPIREVLPFRGEIPARGPEKLVELVRANRVEGVRYYSAKADVEMKDTASNTSFKAKVQCVMDSAAWIKAMGPLGIEGGRVLITSDSLKVLDTLHDHYWLGDTAQARKRFGMKPDLALFQDALLGQPFGLDPEEKYKSDREDGQYTLTSKERRRFRRAAEDLAEDDSLADDKDMSERRLERTLRKASKRDAVVFKYWIEPDSFRVTRVSIVDLAHDQQADVRYSSRTWVNGRFLPTRIDLSLSGTGRKVEATFELERINLDGPLDLVFRVPEKFTPLE